MSDSRAKWLFSSQELIAGQNEYTIVVPGYKEKLVGY